MKLKTYRRLILAWPLGLGLAAALAVAPSSRIIAAETQLELVHPQSDDQGHYVNPTRSIRLTVFGLVSPRNGIRNIAVNGKQAALFHGRFEPWGASADEHALEFRASVRVRPTTELTISIEDGTGAATRFVLQPDAEAATARLRELVSEEPENARAHDRLGNALRDRGLIEDAVSEYRKAIELDPDSVDPRVHLSRALFARQEREQAMSELEKAVEVDPDSPMAWVDLGLAHIKVTGNIEEALRCFRRYLELEPSGSTADKIRRYVEATTG
jgi:tetratricopeptide (TPR) repeat protein